MKKAIKSIMTRLINMKTKIHSHAYPIYVTLVLRHVLLLFWKQCVSTDGASGHMLMLRSYYVIA